MFHVGRFIANAITLGLFAMMYLIWSQLHDMFKFGDITYSISWSVFILMAIFVALLVIDFAILGGPWTPIYPLVLVTLILQNWLAGSLLAAVNYALIKTIGRINVTR